MNTSFFRFVLVYNVIDRCYLPSSFLFNIPTKLSNRTESVPLSHRTTTFVLVSSIPSNFNCTLNPSAARPSSISILYFSTASGFCIFRRACRDQTFSFEKPIPVLRFLRQCHWTGRALSSVFRLEQRSSIEALDMRKVDSDGKGRRCLGKLVIPRDTFYAVVSIT